MRETKYKVEGIISTPQELWPDGLNLVETIVEEFNAVIDSGEGTFTLTDPLKGKYSGQLRVIAPRVTKFFSVEGAQNLRDAIDLWLTDYAPKDEPTTQSPMIRRFRWPDDSGVEYFPHDNNYWLIDVDGNGLAR